MTIMYSRHIHLSLRFHEAHTNNSSPRVPYAQALLLQAPEHKHMHIPQRSIVFQVSHLVAMQRHTLRRFHFITVFLVLLRNY